MKTIEAQVDIAGGREAVWSTLTDFASFPQWNPYIPRMSARLEEGAAIRLTSRLPIGLRLRFKGEMVACETGHRIVWRARPRFLPSGCFDATHSLTLTAADGAAIRVESREEVAGWSVPLMGPILRQAQRGLVQMNSRLQARVEAL